MTLIRGLDIGQKLVEDKGALRHVDQMWTIVREFLSQGRGGCQKAGVATHHHTHVYTRQGGIVEIGAGERLCHKSGCRWKAWRVVTANQVVVDGFWNVDGAQRVVGGLGLFADDAHRVA